MHWDLDERSPFGSFGDMSWNLHHQLVFEIWADKVFAESNTNSFFVSEIFSNFETRPFKYRWRNAAVSFGKKVVDWSCIIDIHNYWHFRSIKMSNNGWKEDMDVESSCIKTSLLLETLAEHILTVLENEGSSKEPPRSDPWNPHCLLILTPTIKCKDIQCPSEIQPCQKKSNHQLRRLQQNKSWPHTQTIHWGKQMPFSSKKS